MQIKRIKPEIVIISGSDIRSAKLRMMTRLLLLCRLNRSQRDGVDDIVNQCATGQVVNRLAHTLQHRPDGDQVGRTLYRFVGGVTGVQIRKMNTVARPATGEFGALDFATSAITAASYCSGPSIIRSGRFSCARRVASRTFSTSLPAPEVPVE